VSWICTTYGKTEIRSESWLENAVERSPLGIWRRFGGQY